MTRGSDRLRWEDRDQLAKAKTTRPARGGSVPGEVNRGDDVFHDQDQDRPAGEREHRTSWSTGEIGGKRFLTKSTGWPVRVGEEGRNGRIGEDDQLVTAGPVRRRRRTSWLS